MITFVLTSCGRIDLLQKTLDSFFAMNTASIERFIITEDSGDEKIFDACKELNSRYGNRIEFLFNRPKLGQTKSIDLAYSTISTPYIFHCEDDWEFYRPGFIEKSIAIAEDHPDILQSWIRPKSDKILSDMYSNVFYTRRGIAYRNIELTSYYTGRVIDGKREVVSNYMGFSFNPGVKRLRDYSMLGSGGYSQFGEEHVIDAFYKKAGYRVVSLSVNDSDGYVKHIGWDRHVQNGIL